MRSLKKSFNIKDTYPTPSKLVKILIPFLTKWADMFIKRNSRAPIIWLPFDRENSNFVSVLTDCKFNVIYSHIFDGQDFFEYEPKEWDIAISNPPFSCKKEVFTRLNELKKPFAMIMNLMALNYQEIGNLFYQIKPQFIIPDKKISFDGKTSSFCSCYVCSEDFLDKTVFVNMPDNNAGKFFEK